MQHQSICARLKFAFFGKSRLLSLSFLLSRRNIEGGNESVVCQFLLTAPGEYWPCTLYLQCQCVKCFHHQTKTLVNRDEILLRKS